MILKQFETVMIDATVNSKFCVSWSDDHKISVTTEDGVHIYELDPFASEVFLNSIGYSWIPNKPAFPLFDSTVNNRLNHILWKLNRSQLCEIIIDSSMPTSLKTCVKPRTVQSLFSPLIGGESYISCLSENGSLDIYKMSLHKWITMISIAEEWISYNMFQAESELDFENLKSRISSLKIVTHAWFKGLADVFLLTGHEDGEIVVWNVSGDKGARVKAHFQAFETPSAVAMEFLPDSSMFAVFVGVAKGRVLTFSFKEMVSPELDLWKERDLIAPSTIKPYHVNSHLYVFTVKHQVILLHILKTLPKHFVHILKTKWFEFPAPIVGLQTCNQLVFVALHNQDLQTLKLCDDDKDVLLLGNSLGASLRTDKDDKDVYCYGLAVSKNSALWVTVSTKVSCTEKSARGATRILISARYPVSYKSFSDPSGSGLVAKILNTDQDIKLTDIMDLLEIKKSEFLGEQALSYLEEADLTMSQLKLLLWEVKLKMFCSHSTDFEAVEDRLKHRIVITYAREQINGSGRSNKVNSSIFSSFLEEENSKKKRDVNFVDCSICKEPLVPENFKMSACANLHRFPRCNISSLPCRGTPYAFCKRCNAVALQEYGDGSHCLYCDGLLILDVRLRPKMTGEAVDGNI